MGYTVERLQKKLTDTEDFRVRRQQVCAALPDEGPVKIFDKDKQLVDAYTYWKYLAQNSPIFTQDDVHSLLTSEGHWKYTMSVEKIEKMLNESPEKFLTYIREVCRPLYAPVQPMLDATARMPEWGFNNHEFEQHIEYVVRTVMYLLQKTDLSKRKINLGILASLVHDSGNSIGRSLHHHASVRMIEKSTQSGIQNEQHWRSAMAAVETHDETVAYPFIEQLMAEVISVLGSEAKPKRIAKLFFEMYAGFMPKIASALRIADKSDICRNRIHNTKILTPVALENDHHFLINAYCPGSSVELKNKSLFVVNISFSLYPNQNFVDVQPNLVIPRQEGGEKLSIVDRMVNVYEQSRKTYFTQWRELLWETYHKRLKVLVVDAFNLYPEIENVEIRFFEKQKNTVSMGNNKAKRQESIVRFSRNTIAQDLVNPQFRDIHLSHKNQKFPEGEGREIA